VPPAPWVVCTDSKNCRVVRDANGNDIIKLEPVDGEVNPDNFAQSLGQWKLLEIYVLLRNNCGQWFDEMKVAGISDIVLPKKKIKPPIPFVPLPVVPTTFYVSEFLGDQDDRNKRTSEPE
jgi:hypothetical protein